MRVAIVDRYVTDTWYSYRLSNAISKYCSVFYYSNKNVWTSRWYPFQILERTIRDRIDVVHLQFELNMFGNTYTNLLIPVLLILIRLIQKKVIVTIHGVISKQLFDSEQIYKIIPQSVPHNVSILKFIMFCMYGSLSKLSSKIIVHAKIFKRWLLQYLINPKKIFIIPHGIETNTEIEPVEKWQHFGSRIVLNFGVITPRKGLETFIPAFANLGIEDTFLVIAGREMSYYRGYSDKIRGLVRNHGIEDKVIFTGFLSDKELHYLFEKAEIVVLPYSICISASGALAIAVQHHKPTIVTDTEFFREELFDEVMFVSVDNIRELTNAMKHLLENEGLRNYLSKSFRNKALRQSWEKIAKLTMEVYA